MVVDSSAFIAVAMREAGWERIEHLLLSAEGPIMPATCAVECHLVLSGKGVAAPSKQFDDLVADFGIRVTTFGEVEFRVARDAFERYGKGRHPARLNFGDCMAYAVAKVEGLPLLYTGDDFAKTDIPSA